MALTAQSFEFYAGDLKSLTIALTNDVLSGSPTAFTPGSGYHLIFTAKESNATPDRGSKFQYTTGVGITHSTTNAIVEVHPVDTRGHGGKTLYFDIQAQSLSSADDVRTVAVGTLVLKRDSTRQTTTSVPLHTISESVPYTGPAGASTFAALTDKATADLPAVNTPLSTALGLKAPLISPSFTTPTLGAASATTVNKITLTAPATGSTLTIADGKTLTASNTLTLTGTDGSTLNMGTGGTLGTAAYKSTGVTDGTLPLLGINGTLTLTETGGSFVTSGQYGYIRTTGGNAKIYTTGDVATISTEGSNATLFTQGDNAAIFTQGANAYIATSGQYGTITTTGLEAGISTQGNEAQIYTTGTQANIRAAGGGYVGTSSTFKFETTGGGLTTTIAHAVAGSYTLTLTPTASSTLTIGASTTLSGGTHSGTNTGDETAARIAAIVTGQAAKTVLVDADEITITDSAASFGGKKSTLTSLWTWIKSKIDAGMTIAGAQTFSGQVQLAAGQAATDAQSAMSRGLGDARFAARYKSFSLNPRDFSSSLASFGAAASDRGSYSIIQAATPSSKALIYADPYAKVFNATGLSYSNAAVFEFSLGLNDGVGVKAGSEFYVQFGRNLVTTTAAQLGSGSKGMGIKITSSGITPFVGNGSAITSGSTYAYSATYIRFILEWLPAVGFNVYTATATGVVTLLGSVTTGLPSGSFGSGTQLEFLVFDLGGATNTQYIFPGNLVLYLP